MISILDKVDDGDLQKFIEAVLEQPRSLPNVIKHQSILESYLGNGYKSERLTDTDKLLKLVKERLGESMMAKLVFHSDNMHLSYGAAKSKKEFLDVLFSNLTLDNNERTLIGNILIEKNIRHLVWFCLDDPDPESTYFMNILPFLLDYSNNMHLESFVETILQPNLIPNRSTSIWRDYLFNDFSKESNSIRPEKRYEIVSLLMGSLYEKQKNDLMTKLILAEDGRLITLVLLCHEEKLFKAITKYASQDLLKGVAQHVFRYAFIRRF